MIAQSAEANSAFVNFNPLQHPWETLCRAQGGKKYDGVIHSRKMIYSGLVDVGYEYNYNRPGLPVSAREYAYKNNMFQDSYIKLINGEGHIIEKATRRLRVYNFAFKNDADAMADLNSGRDLSLNFINGSQAGTMGQSYYTTMIKNINSCNVFQYPTSVMKNYSMAWGLYRGKILVDRKERKYRRQGNLQLANILSTLSYQIKSSLIDANNILHASVLLALSGEVRTRRHFWLSKDRYVGEMISEQSVTPLDFIAVMEDPSISELPANLIAIRQYLRFLIQTFDSNANSGSI